MFCFLTYEIRFGVREERGRGEYNEKMQKIIVEFCIMEIGKKSEWSYENNLKKGLKSIDFCEIKENFEITNCIYIWTISVLF